MTILSKILTLILTILTILVGLGAVLTASRLDPGDKDNTGAIAVLYVAAIIIGIDAVMLALKLFSQ